jgi:hypothetical protein
MSTTEAADPTAAIPPNAAGGKASIEAEVERMSHDVEKPAHHSDRVDKELAQYTSDVRIEISPERSDELRRKIDKRVISVMIATYLLQALDKGTLSFTSIMGLLEDTGLADENGKATPQV